MAKNGFDAGWTPDEDAFLKAKYWDTPAELIARQLGNRSRFAVIGRAHRLKLSADPEQNRNQRRNGQPPKPKGKMAKPLKFIVPRGDKAPDHIKPPPTAVPPVPDRVWQPIEGTTPVHIADLEGWHCRWPVGDLLFCGCRKGVMGTYCVAHAGVAWRESYPVKVAARYTP